MGACGRVWQSAAAVDISLDPKNAMANKPPLPNNRTLVDRVLDRIKNNQVAAVIIVLGIGLGALAGLSDSLRKLSEALPSFSSSDVAGEWHSAPAQFYPIGPEIMILRLQESVGNQLIGDIEFRTLQGKTRSNQFDILDGKREGRKLAFAFSSGAVLYKSTESVTLRETVSGELVDGELRLLYVREGHTGVPVTARRVQSKGASGASLTLRSSGVQRHGTLAARRCGTCCASRPGHHAVARRSAQTLRPTARELH